MGAPVTLPEFDPDWSGPSAWAAMYRSVGLQVVPARYPMKDRTDKRPALAGWTEFQHNLTVPAVFDRWYGTAGEHAKIPNMGLITGAASNNVFVIDLDEHSHPEAAHWWRGLLELNTFGFDQETWCQMTGGGGRQLFFRAPAGWHAPTNRTPIGVDIRGQGGFAMLPPSVHLSGKEYAWFEGMSPWEIPIMDAPQWLLDAVDDLVAQFGGDTRGLTQVAERTASPSNDFDAFGARVDGREDAMTRMVWKHVVAMHRAMNGVREPDSERACLQEGVQDWLRTAKSRFPDVGKVEGLERECRGPTAFRAKWQRAMAKWDGKVAIDAVAGREPLKPEIEATGNPILVPIVQAFPVKGEDIPVRDWIVRGFLLRRYLSVLVAPPGSGKSLLTLQIGIANGIGQDWGGWRIRERSRTLIINAEDDMDEMRRRLWAAAQRMNVRQEDLADNIFLAQAPESIVVAKVDARSKSVVRTPLVEQLIATIIANKISTVIVDPFAETFEGDENSNSEVKWAGILWREVARRASCAVLLVHHTRKFAGDMAGNADASRGGGALIGTARIVSTLFVMTEEEAGTMGVAPDQRTTYVRFDDAKANMSLVTGVARWFRKESVALPNGTIAIPGDEVGVLVPWKPPGMFEGVSMTTVSLCLDSIDRGLLNDDGTPTGRFFTPSANGSDKSRWVGSPVMRLFGCDEAKAKLVVKEWLRNEVLEEFEFTDGKQARKGLRVVAKNRPDRGA